MKNRYHNNEGYDRENQNKHDGFCSPGGPEDREHSFAAFYRNLIRKISSICTEDIACAYWVYLYTQNNRANKLS